MRRAIIFAALALGGVSPSALAQNDPWIEVEDDLSAIAIHAIMLPPLEFDETFYASGLVLYYRRTNHASDPARQVAHLWDPESQETIGTTPNPGHNLFCAGHAIDFMGRVIFAGGTHAQVGGCGITPVTVYDPVLNTMSSNWNMAKGRWYPTVTMDAGGQAYFFSGNTGDGNNDPPCSSNRQIEAFDPYDPDDPDLLHTLSADPPNYPRSHWLSEGLIASVAPQVQTRFFNPQSSSVTAGPDTQIGFARHGATSVLLPVDLRDSTPAERVLLIGGYVDDEPTATCEILEYDVGEEEWIWRDAGDPGDLNDGRAHANAVILANGDVFLVGGGHEGEQGCPIFVPEVFEFDEQTAEGEWTALTTATHTHPRMYHSVALLLMDGSVWTAGQNEDSECPGPCPTCGGGYWEQGGNRVEIYRPPYFFDASRPTITDAPASVEPEEPFIVEFTVGQGRAFSRAAMISLSAVTHSVNMTQRYLILKAEDPVGGEVELTAPEAAFAPPGPYMLVLIDEQGIPSKAEILYLE